MDLEEDISDNHLVRVVNAAVNRLDVRRSCQISSEHTVLSMIRSSRPFPLSPFTYYKQE